MCGSHSPPAFGQGSTLVASQHVQVPVPGSMTMSVDKEFSYAAAQSRRRSVDVGGLALALGAVSLGEESAQMGKGWGGWEESELQGALYAELLSNMYTQTQFTVNQPVLPPMPTIMSSTRQRLIDGLDSWHFEPHKLPDEEVLACTQLLFEALYRVEGMKEAVGVPLAQLNTFLLHLRAAYRAANSYHNFQHALDVFQATHVYLRFAGIVPPVAILNIPESDPRGRWRVDADVQGTTWVGILRKVDIFALYIAAVGHDVGHPGFNNMFMKNAQAPLSQVFDHKSALEQMHCAFLLPIMKRHGMAHLLDSSTSTSSSFSSSSPFSSSNDSSSIHFRRLLLDTVLATDMGVHAQFMQRFGHLMETPGDFTSLEARTLLCQALIKCADISNPSRPHTVSQHWSAALASEWANQASLERQLCLPVSVQDSDDPMTEAKGQIGFITLFCAPLLEVTAQAIPEMNCFSEQCSRNLQLWRSRASELASQTEPNYPPIPYRAATTTTTTTTSSPGLTSTTPQPPAQADFMSVFPLSLPSQFFRPFAVGFPGQEERRGTEEVDMAEEFGAGAGYEGVNGGHSHHGHGHARSVNGSGDQMRMDGVESPDLSSHSHSHKDGNSNNSMNGIDYSSSNHQYVKHTNIDADSVPSSSRSPSPVTFTTAKPFNSTNNNSTTIDNHHDTHPTSPLHHTFNNTSTSTSTNNTTTHPLPPSIGIPTFTTPDYSLVSPTSGWSASASASASPSPRSEFAPRTPGGRSLFSSASTYGSGSNIGNGHSERIGGGGGSGGYNGGGSSVAGSVISGNSGNGSGSVGSGSGGGEVGTGTDASIRAAYKLSVRRKKSFHRNSWAPGPPPPPVPPLPQSAMGAGAGAGAGVGSVAVSGTGAGMGTGNTAPRQFPSSSSTSNPKA